MTPAQAQELFAEMRAAFPSAAPKEGTLKLYLQALYPWSWESGQKAVRSAIQESRFFPSIAELQNHYAIVREQRRREVEAEQRRLERLAEDNYERPPLKDIPAVQEYLAKLRGLEMEHPLVSAEAGFCDDCEEEGKRYTFAVLSLCRTCLFRRLAAIEVVEREERREAEAALEAG